MNKQVITTPGGERLVVMPEAEFEALLDAAEENADRLAMGEYERRLAGGEEEQVPLAVVDRILGGENLVLVWREHRKLTREDLARRSGVPLNEIAGIEAGRTVGGEAVLAALAGALGLAVEDLAA